jgi:hypothetical protein
MLRKLLSCPARDTPTCLVVICPPVTTTGCCARIIASSAAGSTAAVAEFVDLGISPLYKNFIAKTSSIQWSRSFLSPPMCAVRCSSRKTWKTLRRSRALIFVFRLVRVLGRTTTMSRPHHASAWRENGADPLVTEAASSAPLCANRRQTYRLTDCHLTDCHNREHHRKIPSARIRGRDMNECAPPVRFIALDLSITHLAT